MKKNIFSFFFFLFVIFSSFSQTDYFIDGKDTIFCKGVSYKLSLVGYLSEIIYTDLNDQNWIMEGRKNLSNVSTFFIYGIYTDKIPKDIEKPEGYVKWAKRVVNGKLKVNYYLKETTTYGPGGATTGIAKFYIRMPDGTFYDIRSSDLKNYIIPYLKQCEAFNLAYTGNFENYYDSFVSTINLYNSVCN